MKRKNLFRIVSLLIALCMCFGCLSGCAQEEVTSVPEYEEEVLGEFFVEDEDGEGDTASDEDSSKDGSSASDKDSSKNDSSDKKNDKNSSSKGNSNKNDSASTDDKTTSDSTQNNSSADKSGNKTDGGKVTIDMAKLKGQTVTMMMWRELNVSEKKVLENFQKATGFNVKYSVVNQKEYMTKVAAEIAGKSGLDICAIQSGGMSILTSDTYPSSFPVGTYATMQPFFEVTGQDQNESVWAKSWMDPYKLNDKYYGVAIAGGWHTLSTVVYYNVDLFEENGITTPRELWKAGNWNWDTFMDAAKQISDIDDYYYGYAGRDSYAYMLSAGCDYVGYNGKKFTNTSEDAKLKKAWEFSNEMMNSGAQFKPDGSSNFPQLFLEGKFGMYGEGSYCMLDIGMLGDYAYNKKDVDFEIDAVPFPSPKGETATAIHRGNLFGIAKNAKNPVAAGVFLRFWLDPKNSLPFSKTAINNNMRDAFEWINAESTPKKAFLAGGVLGYQDAEKMGNLTYRLLTEPSSQITSTIAMFKSFINTSVDQANKVLN